MTGATLEMGGGLSAVPNVRYSYITKNNNVNDVSPLLAPLKSTKEKIKQEIIEAKAEEAKREIQANWKRAEKGKINVL